MVINIIDKLYFRTLPLIASTFIVESIKCFFINLQLTESVSQIYNKGFESMSPFAPHVSETNDILHFVFIFFWFNT
jgi:hypothetical protein